MNSQFQILRQEIENLKSRTNQCQIEIWQKLKAVETENIWKQKKFYGNDIVLFDKFKKMSFKNYLKEAHNIGNIEYRNTGKILELKNGKDLFTKWGRANMITYLNSSDSEQEKILEAANKSQVTVSFGMLRQKLFPGKTKKIEPENLWKIKYEKLLVEFKKLKKENEQLKSAIEGMQNAYKLVQSRK